MRRKRVNKHRDKASFKNSASKTKAINIDRVHTSRGGIRL